MAKPKKCKNPRCLPCNWWPRIAKLLGADQGCYWIDELTGEVFIATGLRATGEGNLIEIPDDEGPAFYESTCDCGHDFPIREDMFDKGLGSRCPSCAAEVSEITRN